MKTRWDSILNFPFSDSACDEQIAFALHQAEQGNSVGEITRKMGITELTFYRWKKKYGGLMPSELRKLKQLEEENETKWGHILMNHDSENHWNCGATR